MTICLSPGGSSIYNHSQLSSELLVATVDGVTQLKLADNGQWVKSAQTLTDHHVCALLHEPESGRYIAGTHDGGIFLSDDLNHWRASNGGIETPNIYSLAMTVEAGSTILYAGTEPAALYRSDDLGENWSRLDGLNRAANAETWTFPAPPFIGHVKTISIDPADPGHLFVCIEQGGLYSSVDAGENWIDHTAGMPNDAHRLLIHPQRSERVYLANGFFFSRSDDGGNSWFDMADQISRIGYADPLLCHPNRPELMVVAGGYATPDAWATGSAKSAIYRTEDGGDHWSQATEGLPEEIKPSFEAGCIEAAGEQSRIFLGNTHGEVWMSADHGASWRVVVADIPWVSKCFHADLIHGRLVLNEEDVQIPDELREKMAEMVDREG